MKKIYIDCIDLFPINNPMFSYSSPNNIMNLLVTQFFFKFPFVRVDKKYFNIILHYSDETKIFERYTEYILPRVSSWQKQTDDFMLKIFSALMRQKSFRSGQLQNMNSLKKKNSINPVIRQKKLYCCACLERNII